MTDSFETRSRRSLAGGYRSTPLPAERGLMGDLYVHISPDEVAALHAPFPTLLRYR